VAQQAVDDDMQGDEYEEREEKEEPAFNSASAPPALATSPTFIGSPPPLPPSSAAAAAAAREAAALMEEHKEFQPIAPSSSPSSLPELIDVYGVVSRASPAVAAASMQGIRVALPEVQFEPAGLALMLDAPASSAAAARPFSRPDVPDSTAAALGRKVSLARSARRNARAAPRSWSSSRRTCSRPPSSSRASSIRCNCGSHPSARQSSTSCRPR